MRVLVTGAAGFLGSHLVDRLLDEGHSVFGIDNFATGNLDNLAHLTREHRFVLEDRDLCHAFDPGPVDYVFNLASPASPPEYLRVGSLGTQNALEIARRYDAGFLHTSTSECYGNPLQHPQTEEYWGNVNPVGPRSVYDEAKRFSEAMVMAYHRFYGLDTHLVRIFNTYGPRLAPNDGRVISNFVVQALRGEALTIYGSGKQTRSFCYVSDQIEGILRLSRSQEPLPVNIGNPNEFTILECAEVVLRLTGSSSPLCFEPLPQDDPTRRRPDISKAKKILMWEPLVQLEEGIARCIEYFDPMVNGLKALAS